MVVNLVCKLSLAAAACRQMLLMPTESEVAAFSGSTDTGARQAAAVLVIQEAYRNYRQRQLVKVCMALLLCFSASAAPSLAYLGIIAVLDVATAQPAP